MIVFFTPFIIKYNLYIYFITYFRKKNVFFIKKAFLKCISGTIVISDQKLLHYQEENMTERKEYYPLALTIAGSDSGGGAGIQADLRTFSAFGVFGCSAITAVTSQNPLEVSRIDALPGAAVKAQIQAVKKAFKIGAVKTGMLMNAGIIEHAAAELSGMKCPLIVDPVMIATSGARLLEDSAVESMKNSLLPLAEWITPNIHEAQLLADMKITDTAAMSEAGLRCAATWKCNCIVKGGHLSSKGGRIADIVIYQGKVYSLSSPVIENPRASHGTGCTMSAALAAALALGLPWKKAMKAVKDFVFGSLAEEVEIGDGIFAMYPPQASYVDEIAFDRIDN